MPYKSRAQAAYFNANRSKLESEGVDVAEWNAASKGKSVPMRTGKRQAGRMKANAIMRPMRPKTVQGAAAPAMPGKLRGVKPMDSLEEDS